MFKINFLNVISFQCSTMNNNINNDDNVDYNKINYNEFKFKNYAINKGKPHYHFLFIFS
jgi:hypothetical protein